MKNVEEMIACVAITGAVLLAPAQKLFKNAEAMVRENLRNDVHMAMVAPLPPLPPLRAVRPPLSPEVIAPKKSTCIEHDLALAKTEAKLASEQTRMQVSLARNLAHDQIHMQAEFARSQAHWQAEMARQQSRAAIEQARWTGSRGQ